MQNYESKVCVACHPDAPRVTKEQIREFLYNYLEWELIKDNQVPQLKRIYKFNDCETISAFDFHWMCSISQSSNGFLSDDNNATPCIRTAPFNLLLYIISLAFA